MGGSRGALAAGGQERKRGRGRVKEGDLGSRGARLVRGPASVKESGPSGFTPISAKMQCENDAANEIAASTTTHGPPGPHSNGTGTV